MAQATGQRVMVLGATGTIGQAVARALVDAGHEVVCFVRNPDFTLPGITIRVGDVTQVQSLKNEGFCGEQFDAVVSCLASRTGRAADAWAIDHKATVAAIDAAKDAGVAQFVLLSAICVQKPKLAFQRAKLATEDALIASGMVYSIVRPTAFFKSLSGQIERVKAGKPYLMFGDGQLTACKPISDRDLGTFMAGCLTVGGRQNAVLPIGGPGAAVTPLDQGHMLFEALGITPKVKRVPIWFMDGIIAVLATLVRVFPRLAHKAEFARIGRYYATESMLVWDAETGKYDADQTPSFGSDTLSQHYQDVIRSGAKVDLGDHGVF